MTATTERWQPGTESGPEPAAARPTIGLGSLGLAAVAIGMLAAATFRSGAFYPEVALGVAVLAIPLVIGGLRVGDDRRGLLLTLTAGGWCLWWLARAIGDGSAKPFLPFGASVLGFLAAFLAVRPLAAASRSVAARAFVAIGSVSALIGIVGVITHWSAVATVNHGSWRAATTLTYANAAGLLAAMTLLVALGIDGPRWLRNLGVEICVAGLIASQSVAAVVAVLAGAPLVPLAQWRVHRRAIVAGGAVGVAILAASATSGRPWWMAIVVALLLTWGCHPSLETGSTRRRTIGELGLAAVVVVALALTLSTSTHHPFASESERTSIPWRTVTDNWREIGVTGLSPQGVSSPRSPVRISDNLLGNDYLQIGVDGGLIALILFTGSVAAVAYTVRRRGVATSCATGALVAFGVGGFLDFSWHLPAIAVAGGVVGGLASLPIGARVGLFTRGWRSATADRRRRIGWTAAAGALVGVLLAVGLASANPPRPRLVGPSVGAAVAPIQPGADNTGSPLAAPPGPAQFLTDGRSDDTDPFILHVGSKYYLYTSEGATRRNVSVRIGTSLTAWGPAFEAMPVLPPWADPGATWAPDVRKVKGGWALYFSALVHNIDPAEHCVGAAFGPSPVGPFVADDQPMVCQLDHRGTIDPRTFVDADGQLILDFKSEDNANPGAPGPDQNGRTTIWAQRLTPDGRQLVGPRVPLLSPTQSWEGTIVESPQMVKLAGNYWLFFSGGWFNTPGYGIGDAICKGPFGPCTDLSPAPLLGSNPQGTGPGESSVYVDDGQAYLLYNPWHANDPNPTPPRPVAMAPIAFGTNGPYLLHH
jgi:hypothetical protein